MTLRNLRDHMPVFKLIDDAWTLGTSSVPIIHVAGTPSFAMYFTNAGTSGSTSAEGLYVQHTLTGAGQVGGRSRFHLAANAVLGGWSNAIKGSVTYSTAGRTTGLGSAICAEITLSTNTTAGTYAPLESELVADSAVSTGTSTSFLYGNIAGSDGTGKTTINTNAYFFELGAGVVTTTDGMFEEVTVTAAQVFDAALKVKVGGADYFIGLCDDKSFT